MPYRARSTMRAGNMQRCCHFISAPEIPIKAGREAQAEQPPRSPEADVRPAVASLSSLTGAMHMQGQRNRTYRTYKTYRDWDSALEFPPHLALTQNGQKK